MKPHLLSNRIKLSILIVVDGSLCSLVCSEGLTLFSWMLICFYKKATSIFSHWNVETMNSQAGELSEGYRALDSARNDTQYSQTGEKDGYCALTAKCTIQSSPGPAKLSS